MAFDYVATLQAMNEETSDFYKLMDKVAKNQAFLSFRRFISGTWAWPIVNQIMGLVSGFRHFSKVQIDTNKQLRAGAKAFADIRDNIDKLDFDALAPIQGMTFGGVTKSFKNPNQPPNKICKTFCVESIAAT